MQPWDALFAHGTVTNIEIGDPLITVSWRSGVKNGMKMHQIPHLQPFEKLVRPTLDRHAQWTCPERLSSQHIQVRKDRT